MKKFIAEFFGMRTADLITCVIAQGLGAIVGALALATLAKGAMAGYDVATTGLAIGLTLVVIDLLGIRITGTSVTVARSLRPALMVGGTALSQLWLFIRAPLLGAAAAGLLARFQITQSD